jgi:hypothetical protein
LNGKRKSKLRVIFWELPAPFLIEQEWGRVGFKNKEAKEIQIGTPDCTAKKESDC